MRLSWIWRIADCAVSGPWRNLPCQKYYHSQLTIRHLCKWIVDLRAYGSFLHNLCPRVARETAEKVAAIYDRAFRWLGVSKHIISVWKQIHASQIIIICTRFSFVILISFNKKIVSYICQFNFACSEFVIQCRKKTLSPLRSSPIEFHLNSKIAKLCTTSK